MSELILISPNIFTNNEAGPFIESGAVVIRDGAVADIGDDREIRKKYPKARYQDLGEGLLTPGLVNLHHHLYSSLARGWNPAGEPPANFPQVLDRIWWRLDKALELDDIYYSAMVGLCESVRMGVTTVIDHHASQHIIEGSLAAIAKAYKQVGLKGSVCFEITDRGGPEVFKAGLKETIYGLCKWQEFNSESRLKAMVGLHASMTLSDMSLQKIREATVGYDVGYHFHLAEDESDQVDSLSQHGTRATQRFAKYQMLGEKSLAIHGVNLDKDELKLLADSKTNLAICPRSNQNNAVGIPRWWEYDGVSIGLGTDGIGSDMISEAKSGLYISHHEKHDPSFGFGEMAGMLLNSNPHIFEKITGHKVGRIAPGYPADLVFWKYDSPTPIDGNNIAGHYLYGLYNHQADKVWVDGKNIFADGKFIDFDYGEIASQAKTAAKKLWERI